MAASTALEERIAEMRRSGATIPQIARELRVSIGTVHSVLKKLGLAMGRS
jgi:DNA-binding NarL/FixJ family response regulator